jgi:hypothetical protein
MALVWMDQSFGWKVKGVSFNGKRNASEGCDLSRVDVTKMVLVIFQF